MKLNKNLTTKDGRNARKTKPSKPSPSCPTDMKAQAQAVPRARPKAALTLGRQQRPRWSGAKTQEGEGISITLLKEGTKK